MKKLCETCDYWKRYQKLDNSVLCACIGRSSGSNPGSQLYTSADSTCPIWVKRVQLNFKEFRKSIKVKSAIA